MTPETAAAILNVPVDASRSEILTGYGRRARMTHPDRFAGAPQGDIDAASAEFIRVTEARDTLITHLPSGPSSQRTTTTDPPTTARPKQQPPPHQGNQRPTPMSFEQFSAWRQANSWYWQDPEASMPLRQTAASGAARRTPAPSDQGRLPVAAGVALWVGAAVAVLAVSAAVLYALSPQRVADDAAGDSPTIDTAVVGQTEYDDAGQVSRTTDGVDVTVGDADPSVDGSWAWSITAQKDCPGASVTVDFSDSADGATADSLSEQVSLVAGEAYQYEVTGDQTSHGYAALTEITCAVG